MATSAGFSARFRPQRDRVGYLSSGTIPTQRRVSFRVRLEVGMGGGEPASPGAVGRLRGFGRAGAGTDRVTGEAPGAEKLSGLCTVPSQWRSRTTCWLSVPVARACAPRSKLTTRAPRSRSSPSCTRPAATPARPAAASTRRSVTPAQTVPSSTPPTPSRAPTTSATRTRSSSSAARRPATSTSSSAGAPSSTETRRAGWLNVPSAAPGRRAPSTRPTSPATFLLQVLYEQLLARGDPGLRGVLRLAAGARRAGLRGRAGLGSPARRPEGDRGQGGGSGHRRLRARLPGHDQRACLHRRRHGDGASGRAAAKGLGVHAVPPDHDLSERAGRDRGGARRGRLPAQRRGRALHEPLRARRDGAGQPRRRLARRADRDRRGAGRERLASCSTCATSASRRRSSASTAPATWLSPTPASIRSTSRFRCGRAPTITWAASPRTWTAAPRSRTSSRPARWPACRCTAPTGSVATR